MAVCDAVYRLCPVLADEVFSPGRAIGMPAGPPQYTRPEVWRAGAVPEVLLSGNR